MKMPLGIELKISSYNNFRNVYRKVSTEFD